MGRPSRIFDYNIERFFTSPGISILDLFCCSGLAAEGMLSIPGVKVLGVDINHPSYYPGTFLHADTFSLSVEFIKRFNFVWASPPCQQYSRGSIPARSKGKQYPDLLLPTIELLKVCEIAAIVENVPEAGLYPDFMLCGSMFGLNITRHRYFQAINWHPVYQKLYCNHTKQSHTIAGSFRGSIHKAAISMGCASTRLRSELKEGVPPIYAKFILQTFLSMPAALTSTQDINNFAGN